MRDFEASYMAFELLARIRHPEQSDMARHALLMDIVKGFQQQDSA